MRNGTYPLMFIGKVYDTLHEKTIRELPKITVCCMEQTLEAESHRKTTAVRPIVTHLGNHSSKTSQAGGTLLEEQ